MSDLPRARRRRHHYSSFGRIDWRRIHAAGDQPVGGGPPPHVHSREDESFYVVEGDFEFRTAGQIQVISPGAFVFAPRNVPHAFRNIGSAPGKLIIFIQPAGFEQFVTEFATIPPDLPPDFARMGAIAAKHGLQFVQSA